MVAAINKQFSKRYHINSPCCDPSCATNISRNYYQLIIRSSRNIKKSQSSEDEFKIGVLRDQISTIILDWELEKRIPNTTENEEQETLDSLWDKFVEADIIDNIEEDIEQTGEDLYEITSNEGYVVEIIVNEDGTVEIGEIDKGDNLPPRIGEIESSSTSNSIHIEVSIKRSTGKVKLSYYYKKEGEAETSYKPIKEAVEDLTADFTELEQNVVYNIKVVAKDDNGSTEKIINELTAELAGGTIRQVGDLEWNNGTATIKLETSETGANIVYQIGNIDGEWIPYSEEGISGLNHGDIVYVAISDGTNVSKESSFEIRDNKEPQEAIINLSDTNITTDSIVTATVIHNDSESGLDLTKCKYVWNTSSEQLGTEMSAYTDGTFSNNEQQISRNMTTKGTYYLHVLTVDRGENATETISNAIKVRQLATGVSISPTSVTLTEGENTQLTAAVSPATTDNKTVIWESSNPDIASISSSGVITAKAEGSATITVKTTDGSNKVATCIVTVNRKLATNINELIAGEYINYLDKTGTLRKCIVLYDSSLNYGVQIITEDVVEHITLGDNSNFTTGINSYNNAVNTLNTRAEAYINTTYVSDARCVGSVPNNKNLQSGYFTSNYNYMSVYNGKLRNIDTNYETDWNQMETLGIRASNDFYWLASYDIHSDSYYSYFCVRGVASDGNFNYGPMCTIWNTGDARSVSEDYGLRPVFTLKSNIRVTGGNGTKSSPYTLGT